MAKQIIDAPDFDKQHALEVTNENEHLYIPEAVEIETVRPTGAAKGNGGLDAHAQELLFNEEFVEVMVHESTDRNAENPVFTACQGVSQYFFRGEVQRVRRKYVAILAACKEHNISTPEYTAGDGSRAMSVRRTSSLKYPFSIISDPNPRGAPWLKGLLGSPT